MAGTMDVAERVMTPDGADEEKGLVERARRGDRTAFDTLVGLHVRRVWSVVWRILRHREDTEDVTQEVFLAAFQALGDFREEARLSTWLHRIAVTRALNHLDRKEERMRRAAADADVDSGGLERDPDGAAAWLLPAVPTPIQEIEAEELRRRLRGCLERLPGAWRAVLTLRDVDDLSYEEIARLAGLALGTVRSRLARARVALRQCVAGGES